MHDVGAWFDPSRGAIGGGHQLVRGGARRAGHGCRRLSMGRARYGRRSRTRQTYYTVCSGNYKF